MTEWKRCGNTPFWSLDRSGMVELIDPIRFIRIWDTNVGDTARLVIRQRFRGFDPVHAVLGIADVTTDVTTQNLAIGIVNAWVAWSDAYRSDPSVEITEEDYKRHLEDNEYRDLLLDGLRAAFIGAVLSKMEGEEENVVLAVVRGTPAEGQIPSAVNVSRPPDHVVVGKSLPDAIDQALERLGILEC